MTVVQTCSGYAKYAFGAVAGGAGVVAVVASACRLFDGACQAKVGGVQKLLSPLIAQMDMIGPASLTAVIGGTVAYGLHKASGPR
ncbi:MAG: hypothetical protein DI551_02025 [Micavibrio aeruginosavorus]|uniref:Uncharacterized protein n=1 Tax=Micavibrio aeruginosavorus TaxID=349221 RepID=A0A2W5PZX6_9BACT|nr:MAG: hypothetical protein DI551_02025 [Micavibrio aeruginosavorus]